MWVLDVLGGLLVAALLGTGVYHFTNWLFEKDKPKPKEPTSGKGNS